MTGSEVNVDPKADMELRWILTKSEPFILLEKGTKKKQRTTGIEQTKPILEKQK